MRLNKKNKVLFAGFVVSLIVCYKFAFSNTLEYRSEYKRQQESANKNIETNNLLPLLKKKDKILQEQLKQYSYIDSASFQNELLGHIGKSISGKNLKIVKFEEPHIYHTEGIKSSSYPFSIEGNFNETLLLLNDLENEGALGFIRHVSLLKKMNYRTNTNYLVTDIILQKNETENKPNQ